MSAHSPLSPRPSPHLCVCAAQTWVLYTSHEIQLAASTRGLLSEAPYDGSVRLAALSDSADADAAVFDSYAARIPTGVEVQAIASGDSATLSFAFSSVGDGQLLMMALPHHMDTLAGVQVTDIARPVLRGKMVGVTGEQWTLTEPLTSIEWSPPRPIADQVSSPVRTERCRHHTRTRACPCTRA